MAKVSIFVEDGELKIISCLPKSITVARAKIDTPYGLPFKLIDFSDLPEDYSNRERWFFDGDLSTDNDGYGERE